MYLPKARGSFSSRLFSALQSGSGFDAVLGFEPESDDDAQIALWALYELSFRGFENVDDALEWHPPVVEIRGQLEADFEAELRSRFPNPEICGDFSDFVFEFIARDSGPSVAKFAQREADRSQMVEILKQRSIYHLKESDPVAMTVARLETGPKAALMELQYDEFGGGNPNRLHSHLFALGLEASGLDGSYGAYVNEALVETLALNNAMSFFGLHRRLRGASVGHLAAFEATSSLPCRKMSQGLHRLGFSAEMIRYYDEHVEADAVHEQLAVRSVCGLLVCEEPEQAQEVLFGVFTCLDLENRFARAMFDHWGVSG